MHGKIFPRKKEKDEYLKHMVILRRRGKLVLSTRQLPNSEHGFMGLSATSAPCSIPGWFSSFGMGKLIVQPRSPPKTGFPTLKLYITIMGYIQRVQEKVVEDGVSPTRIAGKISLEVLDEVKDILGSKGYAVNRLKTLLKNAQG